MNRSQTWSRRALLTGASGLATAAATGTTARAADRGRPSRAVRALVAANEPWGTYHIDDLLPEVRRRGADVTMLVPDLSHVDPADAVPVATLDDAPEANLLVLAGAGDWPATCARSFREVPHALSALAYLGPEEAEHAREVRRGVAVLTAPSPAAGRAFGSYLRTGNRIRIVGDPQTDSLPARRPEPGTVLVLTSVTYPDETGDAAPGTELLRESAARLAEAGRHVVVGLHPREDPGLWDAYEISAVPSVEAAARAEAAIGIPGTVFPLVTAVGTPVVGCVAPELQVPDYLTSVCSSTIDVAADAVSAVRNAELPAPEILADAVGPVGGSAARLLDAWGDAVRPSRGRNGTSGTHPVEKA